MIFNSISIGDRTYKSVKDWINRHSSIFLSEEEKTGQAFDDDEGMYNINSYGERNLTQFLLCTSGRISVSGIQGFGYPTPN